MKKRPLCLVALIFVLWIIGMKQAGEFERTPLPDSYQDQRICVRGEIYRQETKKNHLIYLKNNSILSKNKTISYLSNILIFTTEEQNFEIGNILEVEGICSFPEEVSNPGQFDMASWYQSQGIGMLVTKGIPRLLDSRNIKLPQILSLFRERCKQSFYAIGEEEDAALLSAMVLGEKNDLPEEIKSLYQRSGISHVLAISGLHISMIGMVLFQFFRRCGLPFRAAGGLCSGILGLYCLLTGFGVSTQRAFVMFLVYLGAQILGKTYDLKSALSLAGLLILIRNPLLLFQGGFQLSVLAVAGLAFLYPVLQEKCMWKGKLADSLLISLSVQLAIFPCMLYHYFSFSLVGVFLNLLILPFMSLLLLFGMGSCILGMIFVPAGMIGFAPCHYILKGYEFLCQASLKFPEALQIWGRPRAGFLCLYYGILLLVFLSLKKEEIWHPILYSAALLCALSGLHVQSAPGMEMVFLDVGQGDGIFWQTEEGTTFLCDGGSSSVSEVETYRIIPFLKSKGVGRLDYIFVTHMDEDHVNGIEELLEKEGEEISVKHLILPELLKKDTRYQKMEQTAIQKGIQVLTIRRGKGLTIGKLMMRCLAPRKGETGAEKNESSLVLEVSYGKFIALLTGDVEGTGEEDLVDSGSLRKISVLKVAHHGSKGTTSEAFLEEVNPRVSVISCGKKNRYGHPHLELMNRLEQTGTKIYQTKNSGAVRILTDGGGFSVSMYRMQDDSHE